MCEKIELRTTKLNKKNWTAVDMLEETKYDCRYIIPIWKWKIIHFLLKYF